MNDKYEYTTGSEVERIGEVIRMDSSGENKIAVGLRLRMFQLRHPFISKVLSKCGVNFYTNKDSFATKIAERNVTHMAEYIKQIGESR